MSIVFDFKDIRSRIKGDPMIRPKARIKCEESCPGDETCENHQYCICGLKMLGHEGGYDGHAAISAHEHYGRLNNDPSL